MKRINIITSLVAAFAAVGIAGAAPDLFRVQQNGKFGFIDKGGTVVIPITLAAAGEFSEGLATVGGPFGRDYIDTSGKMMNIGRKYLIVSEFSEGLA